MSRKLFVGIFMIMVAALTVVPVFAQDVTAEPTGEATDVAPEVTPVVEPTMEATLDATEEEEEDDEPTEVAPTADATMEATEAAGGPPPFEMPPLPAGAEIVAQGLNYPRQLAVGPDGTIYVAEVGAPGNITVPGPDGVEITFGFTGSITAIAADGQRWPVVPFLPSVSGEGAGASGVAIGDGILWVALNGAGPLPITPPSILGAFLRVDSANGRITDYIDMYTLEVDTDPDGLGVDSNPTAVKVAPDGTVYFVDTGMNTIFTWTDSGGFQPWHTWTDNTVPTSIAWDADGNAWVSFLGTEIAPGAGHIEMLSADGSEVLETWGGYNALTDIAVAADGSVYVVSALGGFGAQGPLPGQVIEASADGGTVIADGVLFPYGIAIDTDGSLLVTTGTAFLPPGTGMILRFQPGA